jgi:hypothetical protein
MVTVAFDQEHLDYVSAVNVPLTIERVIQLLEEEPTHKTIGPLHVGHKNVRTVTATRTCMYLPFRYMSLVLGQDLTAREACLHLLPAIVSDGLQLACRELVDFLVVGVTKSDNNQDDTRLVLPRLGMRDFHASPTVISSVGTNGNRTNVQGRNTTAVPTVRRKDTGTVSKDTVGG